MLDYIRCHVLQQKIDPDILGVAKQSLEELTQSSIPKDNSWSLWQTLRCRYSDHRFSQNERDRIDHTVYTSYFLQTGNVK